MTETDFSFFDADQRNYRFKEVICIFNKSVGICDPALIIPRPLDMLIISKKIKTEVVWSSLLSLDFNDDQTHSVSDLSELSLCSTYESNVDRRLCRSSLIFSSRSDRRKLFHWNHHRSNGLVGSIRCRWTLSCRFSLSNAGECAFSIYSSR